MNDFFNTNEKQKMEDDYIIDMCIDERAGMPISQERIEQALKIEKNQTARRTRINLEKARKKGLI